MDEGRAPRVATIGRSTSESSVELRVDLDGTGESRISTGVRFYDHMLASLAKHALVDLTVTATGDIDVDAHHTVEDVGLVLGQAFREALGERRGIVRYASFLMPMDETLAECVIDFGGRPAFVWGVGAALDGRWVGGFDAMLAKEFFAAFANTAQCNLHFRLHYGENAHHIIEALFKAFARAADAACKLDPRLGGAVPSTKGTLTK